MTYFNKKDSESIEKLSSNAANNYEFNMFVDQDAPTTKEEKALIRKIDFFIMPIICVIDFLQVKVHSTQYKARFTFMCIVFR